MATESATMLEDAKGKAKEAAGKLTGSDELVQEGQAQQEKAEAREDAQDAKQRQEQHSA